MNIILLTLGAVFLACPYVQWLNERRLRKLAFCRLQIAKSVSEMEQLMASGELRLGQVCHDHVFSLMLKVQMLDHYPMPKLPGKLTDQQRQFRKQLIDELQNGKSPAAKPLRQFVDHYFAAFHFNRPIVSRFYTLTLLSLLLIKIVQLAFLVSTSPKAEKKKKQSIDVRYSPKTAFTVQSSRWVFEQNHAMA